MLILVSLRTLENSDVLIDIYLIKKKKEDVVT